MITPFNRKEIFTTLSVNRQNNAKAALKALGITFKVKMKNLQSGAPVGMHGENLLGKEKAKYEYKFFVHKKDYEKAKLALKQGDHIL